MTNVLDILNNSPQDIAHANVRVIEAERAFKLASAKLAATRSAYTLKHRDEKNARLIEARVESEKEVQDLVIAEIEAEAAFRVAKNNADELYNAWVSARKLAGLDDRELQAIRGSTIQLRPKQ